MLYFNNKRCSVYSAGHYQPYDTLEKHQKRIVDNAREAAFRDMDSVKQSDSEGSMGFQ